MSDQTAIKKSFKNDLSNMRLAELNTYIGISYTVLDEIWSNLVGHVLFISFSKRAELV